MRLRMRQRLRHFLAGAEPSTFERADVNKSDETRQHNDAAQYLGNVSFLNDDEVENPFSNFLIQSPEVTQR